MRFVSPARLTPDQSTIGLIAPSGVVNKGDLEKGIGIIEGWGYKTKLGKHVFAQKVDYSAGSSEERFSDLLEMVDDKKVEAVGCIVGGYSAPEILKYFTPGVCQKIVQNPKIFFGYSDFCLILNLFFANGVISLHAPNVGGLFERNSATKQSLRQTLLGESPAEITPSPEWKSLACGRTKGRLLVSNLESLINLFGTKFDPLESVKDSVVLALEEVGENKSLITRWLQMLFNHRSAEKIKGIILGCFTGVQEKDYPRWGRKVEVEDLFIKTFEDWEIPIASWPRFGHTEKKQADFFTLPLGVRVIFEVINNSGRLKFLENPLV